jgi:hypothetical protein
LGEVKTPVQKRVPVASYILRGGHPWPPRPKQRRPTTENNTLQKGQLSENLVDRLP